MTDTPVASFNLVDEPWILVQMGDGSVTELSLMEVFELAPSIRQLVGELPTQVFALNRLLLAIMYRATDEPISADDWKRFWRERRLPVDEIGEYLSEWSDRFELLHPTTPFYQVADLHTDKGELTGLTRLIGDAPVGHPFLTTRVGGSIDSLSYAEAARWLVHCQAFDVSGIKSGAADDPRVKGGKGYPIGMAAAGHIGGLLVEGDDQLQTLLLNLIPRDPDNGEIYDERDFAAWELDEPYGAAPAHREDGESLYRPTGLAEVLTWQSRRIRLVHDGDRVRRVLVCNGDRFSPYNLRAVEAMTAWRRSRPQEKRLGLPEVYMPQTHSPERALWRGLEALLGHTDLGAANLPPATHAWIGTLSDSDFFPGDFVTRTRAIGMEYISNASVVGEIVDDELAIPVRVLRRERTDLRNTVVEAAHDTKKIAAAYALLEVNLDRAAGGEGEVRESGSMSAFVILDPLFRRWLIGLRHPSVAPLDARQAWADSARQALLELADRAVSSAGPAAWVGREVDGRHVDSALAESWFRKAVFSTFPHITASEESA